MFKVSEEIYLAASDSANHSKTYGVFKKSQTEDDSFGNSLPVFVSPEVTEVNKIQVLHLPTDNIILGKPVEFFIRKNGARGNVQVKLVNVKNQSSDLPLQILDPDRYLCQFVPDALGVQKIRVYLNTVELPCSPLPLYVRAPSPSSTAKNTNCPTSTTLFPSDSSPIKVRCHGAGITGPVFLQQRNQFTVDASQAGNNVLFVAVYGPQGQCDNLTIRHLGKNVYNASYALTESGTYAIIVKWGDESITGSPFEVVAS